MSGTCPRCGRVTSEASHEGQAWHVACLLLFGRALAEKAATR